jgi:hypothetical protein
VAPEAPWFRDAVSGRSSISPVYLDGDKVRWVFASPVLAPRPTLRRCCARSSTPPKLEQAECTLGDGPGVWAPVAIPASDLTSVVANLVDNASHYGRSPDGVLRLRAAAAAVLDTLEITFEDDGRGVAPPDQAHMFEPFYRGDGRPGRQPPLDRHRAHHRLTRAPPLGRAGGAGPRARPRRRARRGVLPGHRPACGRLQRFVCSNPDYVSTTAHKTAARCRPRSLGGGGPGRAESRGPVSGSAAPTNRRPRTPSFVR